MAALTNNVSGVLSIRILLSTASTQLFFTGAVDMQILNLILQQDATGGRAVTSGNIADLPQPDQTANADTPYTLMYDAAANEWVVMSNGLEEAGGSAVAYTAAGAITVQPSLNTLGGASAQAYTLAAPVAGSPLDGGQDGLVMTFTLVTAHAHTLTTPANKINGAYDTVTFAAVGDSITLQASGGVWYVIGSHGTATLSEV